MNLRTLLLALSLSPLPASCRKPAAPPPDPLASLHAHIQSLDMPEAQSDASLAPPAGIYVIVGAHTLEINARSALAAHPAAERSADPSTLAWIRGRSVPFAAQNPTADGLAPAVLIPALRDGLQALAAWHPAGGADPLPVTVFLNRALTYRQADAILAAVARAGYHAVHLGLMRGGAPRAVELSLPDSCLAAELPSARCAVSRVRMLPAGYLVQALAYHREQLACVPREGDSAAAPSPNDTLQPTPPAMPTLLGPQGNDGVRQWVGRVMFGPHKVCPSVPRPDGGAYDSGALRDLAREVVSIATGCPLSTVVPGPSTPWGDVALTAEALRADGQITVRLGRPDPRTDFDCVGAVRPGEVLPER